jgi:hypothetical protein
MAATPRKKNTISRIQKSLEAGAWLEARGYIQEELVAQPTDHWLWFSLGLT